MQTEFQDLINYRIQQANETIKEVEFQIENNFLVIAVNRIYYGMFYMLLALALKNGFKTSKHNQLLGWFNREFVKTGKIDRKIGKIVHKAFEDRTDGDYGIFVKFEKEEVIEKLENMKRFLFELEKLIKEN
jgi:uncharacterized protein (UPF0332 family)